MKKVKITAVQIYGHLRYETVSTIGTAENIELQFSLDGPADDPRINFERKRYLPQNWLRFARQKFTGPHNDNVALEMVYAKDVWQQKVQTCFDGENFCYPRPRPKVFLAGGKLDGQTFNWSAVWFPKLGERVRITMNQLGTGLVVGYAVMPAGAVNYAAVIVSPDIGQRPDWHIAQKTLRCDYVATGAEIEKI